MKTLLSFLSKNARLSHEKDSWMLTLPTQELLSTCDLLKNHASFQFTQLLDIAAVDFSQFEKEVFEKTRSDETAPPRFSLFYTLFSWHQKTRLHVRVNLENDSLEVSSLTSLWPNANWLEREVYDFFGISFIQHPDLTRLFLEETFEGFPLRKDFPVEGKTKLHYDPTISKITSHPLPPTNQGVSPKKIMREKGYWETQK